jgi:hypothetical protein
MVHMIDTLTILISTIMCVYVVVRAIKLDKTLPWYHTIKITTHKSKGNTKNA